MMQILSLLNSNFIKYASVAVVIGYVILLQKQNIELLKDNERVTENYTNALKIDSLKVAVFKVKNQNELEELINQNKELSELLSKTNIRKKRIQNLYYQQQKYVDSVKKKMDVSGLVSSIRKDIPATLKWKDSSECLSIKGAVNYNNDSLNVTVTDKKYQNNIILLKHKTKRKRIKWLLNLRLGERRFNFTQKSKCGTGKVTVIEK
ncbi:hypothetical protein [Tenacibaculum finnmarkense]|uniref:hypothetical protein n=1 Tax=Tenacibaculum finnmarkense TaxID=2781243 RepID=UPI001EFAD721|nr:hypothetical protein [Tenacibaculum finnmarkense]MCG8734017.1 hypothetical protein [Tenacibaculum finnmarkense]